MQEHTSLKNHENKLDMLYKFLIDNDGIESKQLIEYAKISLKIRSINKDNEQNTIADIYNSVQGDFSKIKDSLEYTKVDLDLLDVDKVSEEIRIKIAMNSINTDSVINAFKDCFEEITRHKTNNRYGENREITSKDIEILLKKPSFLKILSTLIDTIGFWKTLTSPGTIKKQYANTQETYRKLSQKLNVIIPKGKSSPAR